MRLAQGYLMMRPDRRLARRDRSPFLSGRADRGGPLGGGQLPSRRAEDGGLLLVQSIDPTNLYPAVVQGLDVREREVVIGV